MWVIVLVAGAAYGTGLLLTARELFRRWRPYRVPACTEQNHYEGRHDLKRRARRTPQWGLGHGQRCYQRRHADLSLTGISTDLHAAWRALLAALAWPVTLAALFVRADPPELAEEKAARLAALDKQIAGAQAELDRARARELKGKS
jgi:hypothetical protein